MDVEEKERETELGLLGIWKDIERECRTVNRMELRIRKEWQQWPLALER